MKLSLAIERVFGLFDRGSPPSDPYNRVVVYCKDCVWFWFNVIPDDSYVAGGPGKCSHPKSHYTRVVDTPYRRYEITGQYSFEELNKYNHCTLYEARE